MRNVRQVTGLGTVVALVLLSAGPAAATTTGLWHMNEGAGATTMADSSGYGNGGRLHNVRTGRGGYSGYGYEFERYSIASIPSAASLNPGKFDFTVTTYVNTTARASDWNVTQKGYADTAGGSWKIEIRPRNGGREGVLACVFRGTTSKLVLVGGPNVTDGRWHRLVCAKHATSIALQVDHGPIYRAYSSRALGTISNNEPMVIGSKRLGDDQYVGHIDEESLAIAYY